MQEQLGVGDGESVAGVWTVSPLADGAVVLQSRQHEAAAAALLMRSCSADRETWLVMSVTQSGVRLNGAPLRTGISILHDCDELLVDGLGRTFFSTECLPCIEPFPGAARPVFCPRCKQAIALQAPAVRCPQCGVWHHQSEGLPCWTYAEQCGMCDQPTDLAGTYRWTPEEL